MFAQVKLPPFKVPVLFLRLVGALLHQFLAVLLCLLQSYWRSVENLIDHILQLSRESLAQQLPDNLLPFLPPVLLLRWHIR